MPARHTLVRMHHMNLISTVALVSPLYDEQSQKSYFEQVHRWREEGGGGKEGGKDRGGLILVLLQCFDVIEKLGEGSFGEVRKLEGGEVTASSRSMELCFNPGI